MQSKSNMFQNSTLEVQVGYGTPKVVTGISKANPAVVTSTAHGQLPAAVGRLNDIDGMTELDDQMVVVAAALTANTFSLVDVNSTTYGTFTTGSPNDSEFEPVTFSPYCELTGFNKQGAAADQVPVTTICSKRKEFRQGLADTGTAELSYNWALGSPVQQALEAAETSGETIAVRLTDEDGNKLILLGTVQQTSFQGQTEGVWSGTASMKLSGVPYVVMAP